MRSAKLLLSLTLFLGYPGASIVEEPGAASEPSTSQCRVLVNFRGQPFDPASGMPDWDADAVSFVADLRIGVRTEAETGPGMVVRAGADTWALELVGHKRSDTGPNGTSTHREWNDLVATRLPNGEPRVWIDGEPRLTFPEPDSQHSYEDHRFHAVQGIFGPWVSIDVSTHGYSGGAHGYTHDTFRTVRAPAGEKVSLDVLGSEALAAVVAAVGEESERRREEGGGDDSDLVPPDDLGEAGLSFDSEGRLTLSVVLFCCTWAENHNTLDVDAALPRVPAVLEPYFRLPDDPGEDLRALVEAPDGCGAVGLFHDREGAAVRLGGSGEPTAVWLPGYLPREIVGVYWIAAEDSFRTSMLPRPAAGQ